MNLHQYPKFFMVALLLCAISNDIVAQEASQGYSITTKVQSSTDIPVEIGNVLILSPSDSSLLMGDVFYHGEVVLKELADPHFILKITALGYEDHTQAIHLVKKSTMLEPIILSGTYLEGVEVSSNRHIVEKRGTDLIVNVANTALSDAGTIQDVLQNAPKIDINRNGQISVLGKGQAVIFVDGQQIASTQILSSLSSKEVAKIEIIENPPASFDASGNAVINIVTKTKTLEGYKLGLTQEIGYGKHFRSFFQVNAYWKYKGLMVQGDVGMRPQTMGNRFRQTRTYLSDLDPYYTDNQYLLKNKGLGQNFSIRTSYGFNNGMSLGLNYNGTNSRADKRGNNYRTVELATISALDISTLVTGTTHQHSNTLSLFLRRSGENKLTYQWQGQYSDFGLDRGEWSNQDIKSMAGLRQLLRRSQNTNGISIYTLQADFQKAVRQKIRLEWGAKNAFIRNRSYVGLNEILEDGEEISLPAFTNDFNYHENILASYLQVHWSNQSHFSLTMGLRGEWTTANSTAEDIPGGVLERNYYDLFPSFSIQYSFNDHTKASLSYNNRIIRPPFQDLNPYVLYVDSLVSLQGNAYLVPEGIHSIALGVSHKVWAFDLSYVRTNHKINQIFRSRDRHHPNVISFVKENLNYTDLYLLSATGNISYNKYNAYISFGGFYDKHDVQDISTTLANDRFGYYFQVNQFVGLPWGFQLGGYARYTSARVDGVYIDDPMSYLNLTLSKKFVKDQLTVRLWYNDVLDDWRFTGISSFNNMHMNYVSEGDWNFIKLSMNWNFGKLSGSANNPNKISKDELNRIGNM